MKCEICHKADAKKAITRSSDNGKEEELYVCEACAKAERQKRQKKSCRTRRISGPGVEMSITEIHGGGGDDDDDTSLENVEDPTPIFHELADAFDDLITTLSMSAKESKKSGKNDKDDKAVKQKDEEDKYVELPAARIDPEFRVRDGFHLEGLSLIGELEAVKRAMHALDIRLVGIDADGIADAGHVYRFKYDCPLTTAKRVASDLIREERNARIRLLNEMPRIFGDAICRALAALKNCRMLSQGELFDMLSPLRLAAFDDLLEGTTLKAIEREMSKVDLSNAEEMMLPEERDEADANRADEYNKRFEDVMLNEKAEGMFL